MYFAFDCNDNRVHIDDTQSNQKYWCPYCGEELITRKGDVRAHHFAHKKDQPCTDSWEREHTYDMTPWHNEWQSLFPRENQEIKLALGDTKHRADVLIGRTVVEFQHSAMNAANFDNRNNFYFNLGYKVVWLFDLSDNVQEGRMTWRKEGDILRFDWNNPQKAFNAYDVQSGCIDLFFQLSETEEKCIVMVRDVSPQGFEHFSASDLMSKDEFLSFLGVTDGHCPAPICDEDQNAEYLAFKEKYGITLNKQQERALLAVEGAVLLLAVPGSGKTTVLVDRLGYMTHVKHIPPEQILAVTFGKKAAGEMKTRFSAKYGKDIAEKISFQTINSLSFRIYKQYCSTVGKQRRTINNDEFKALRNIYGKYHPNDYPSEEEIVNLASAFGYVKNMMRDKNTAEYNEEYPHFSDMYRDYQAALDKNQRMDFDDQMVYADAILKKRPEILAQWQSRFKYILVDEAQDTSKIQHEIIRMLAEGNNLFMVGDEDQSIYGFRGSFPKAMLNFRYDYKNPYILRMERNYRSTPEIVDKAQQFISQNKGRYEKHMTAVREPGGSFICEQVDSVKAQYDRLLEVALHRETQTAFLYRDNESAVILVDRFLRNNIDFILRAPNFNFFSCRIVREIKAYLTIAIDPYNAEMLNIICNTGILFLKANPLKYAVSNSKQRHITVYDALEEQMEYVKEQYKDRASTFKMIMEQVAKLGPADAIRRLMTAGYSDTVSERGDAGRLDVLTCLAGQEPDIPAFLKRLEYLEQAFTKGFTAQTSDPVILSTIHTAKGLEYDTVYMADVYDGRFPSYKPDPFYRSKDNADPGQEERRLFYVGITRAKNKLVVMSINGRPSSFIDELFPEIKEQREKEQLEKERKEREQKEKERRDWEEREKALRILERLAKEKAERERKEQEEREREQRNKEAAERYWARKAAEDEERKRQYLEEQTKRQQQQGTPHKDEILPLIDTNTLAVDSTGNRWVKCTVCGKISPSCVFAFVGENAAHPNYGRCNACTGKRTR